MRRGWSKIFKVSITKQQQQQQRTKIVYPGKFSFKSEGEMKTFSGKQNSRECVASRPAMGEILKEIL